MLIILVLAFLMMILSLKGLSGKCEWNYENEVIWNFKLKMNFYYFNKLLLFKW